MYLYIIYLFAWPVFCCFVRTPIFRVFRVMYLYSVEHQFLFVLLCTHLSLCSIPVPNYFSHPMWCTSSLPSEWQSLRRSLPRNDNGQSSCIFRKWEEFDKKCWHESWFICRNDVCCSPGSTCVPQNRRKVSKIPSVPLQILSYVFPQHRHFKSWRLCTWFKNLLPQKQGHSRTYSPTHGVCAHYQQFFV